MKIITYKAQLELLKKALRSARHAYMKGENRFDDKGKVIPKETFYFLYHSQVFFKRDQLPLKVQVLDSILNDLSCLDMDKLSEEEAKSVVEWLNVKLVNFFTQVQKSDPHRYSLVRYMIDALRQIEYVAEAAGNDDGDDDAEQVLKYPSWVNFDPDNCSSSYRYDGVIRSLYISCSVPEEKRQMPGLYLSDLHKEIRNANDDVSFTAMTYSMYQDSMSDIPKDEPERKDYQIKLDRLFELECQSLIDSFYVECHGQSGMKLVIKCIKGGPTIQEIFSTQGVAIESSISLIEDTRMQEPKVVTEAKARMDKATIADRSVATY